MVLLDSHIGGKGQKVNVKKELVRLPATAALLEEIRIEKEVLAMSRKELKKIAAKECPAWVRKMLYTKTKTYQDSIITERKMLAKLGFRVGDEVYSYTGYDYQKQWLKTGMLGKVVTVYAADKGPVYYKHSQYGQMYGSPNGHCPGRPGEDWVVVDFGKRDSSASGLWALSPSRYLSKYLPGGFKVGDVVYSKLDESEEVEEGEEPVRIGMEGRVTGWASTTTVRVRFEEADITWDMLPENITKDPPKHIKENERSRLAAAEQASAEQF